MQSHGSFIHKVITLDLLTTRGLAAFVPFVSVERVPNSTISSRGGFWRQVSSWISRLTSLDKV